MPQSLQKYTEKRKFVRYVLDAKARFETETGAVIAGDVENISVGGIFLQLNEPINKDYENAMGSITLSALVSDEEQLIEAFGRIVHITPQGVGIFFEGMSKESRNKLSGLIKVLRELLEQGGH